LPLTIHPAVLKRRYLPSYSGRNQYVNRRKKRRRQWDCNDGPFEVRSFFLSFIYLQLFCFFIAGGESDQSDLIATAVMLTY
jgi:hypothetical protein